MKKMLFAVALSIAAVSNLFADNRERPITVDKLPAAAQQFLADHFKGLTVAFASEDPKITGSEYEVTYTDRTEVDFRNDGEWTSVERRYEAVPASVVPKQIADYVARGGYGGQYIRKIERDRRTWEIELSGGREITFDRNFNVIEVDD